MGSTLVLIAAVAVFVLWAWYSGTPGAKAAQAARVQKAEEQRAKIICPYCQQPGHVTVAQERRVKRKTATRFLGAAVTMGGSLPLTGVSKKGTVTTLSCSNCGMKWDAPKAQP